MVEQNRSGVYGEMVYTPSGDKLALMSGQSLSKAFVPPPEGAPAVYASNGCRTLWFLRVRVFVLSSVGYDDADQLASVTDAVSNVTTYAYGTQDNLTGITDAKSNATFFTRLLS